ncbi:MAG: zinc ribbon domain-containing protein [Sheuella sp.]|nr:zinc ribbon domain-containing protein [Sheuella sp.]
MPTYDYDCKSCGPFDALRQMSKRDESLACPACGALSARFFAFGSNLSRVDSDTRRAIEGNERAAHVPKMSKDYDSTYARLKHPSGCGCCSSASGKRSATQTFANGNKTFVGKRPWMISH